MKRSKLAAGCCASAACLILFVVLHGPRTSADIQLNTGDKRIRYLGVPLEHQMMPEPYRSRLLALSAGSRVATDAWVKYQSYPLPIGHDNERLRGEYANVVRWAQVDRRLARMLLEDLCLSVEGRPSMLPGRLLREEYFSLGADGEWRPKAGWQTDADVLRYLSARSSPPPAPLLPEGKNGAGQN